MKRSQSIAVLMAGLIVAGVAVAQAPVTTRIRGEIVALNGNSLTVHRHSGDTVDIALAPATPLSSVRKILLKDIKPGEFIGTAARTDARGNLQAQEVVVFPESARGTGEGHYAWDLGPKSTMTNANVDAIVDSTDGSDLHLSYKGGKKTVTVPANVPIVTFIPAQRSDLVTGRKVFVVTTTDSAGLLTAQRIVVEKDGVVPPM
jgi:hypothetical protein